MSFVDQPDVPTAPALEFRQNQDLFWQLGLGDPDDTSWDLDGIDLIMEFRVDYPPATGPKPLPKLQVSTTEGGIEIADATARIIQVHVPWADVDASLTDPLYLWDLVGVRESDGFRQTLLEGTAVRYQGVTQGEIA